MMDRRTDTRTDSCFVATKEVLLHLRGRQAGRKVDRNEGRQEGQPVGWQAGWQEGRQAGHAGLSMHRLGTSHQLTILYCSFVETYRLSLYFFL